MSTSAPWDREGWHDRDAYRWTQASHRAGTHLPRPAFRSIVSAVATLALRPRHGQGRGGGIGDLQRRAQSVTLQPGTAVQRTTKGVLIWSPAANLTELDTADGFWILQPDGPLFYRWFDSTPSAPPTPVPTSVQAQRDAEAGCTLDATNALLSVPIPAPQADQQRAQDQMNAIAYLCGQAVDRYGPKGLTCFRSAWQAAVGMERVFPGAGRQTYDQRFADCVSTR